jgi:hypothetical protein
MCYKKTFYCLCILFFNIFSISLLALPYDNGGHYEYHQFQHFIPQHAPTWDLENALTANLINGNGVVEGANNAERRRYRTTALAGLLFLARWPGLFHQDRIRRLGRCLSYIYRANTNGIDTENNNNNIIIADRDDVRDYYRYFPCNGSLKNDNDVHGNIMDLDAVPADISNLQTQLPNDLDEYYDFCCRAVKDWVLLPTSVIAPDNVPEIDNNGFPDQFLVVLAIVVEDEFNHTDDLGESTLLIDNEGDSSTIRRLTKKTLWDSHNGTPQAWATRLSGDDTGFGVRFGQW